MSERPIARRALALATFALLVGCAGDEGGRGSASEGGSAVTKGDDLEETAGEPTGGEVIDSDHREDVLACEAVAEHVREHLNSQRVAEIVDLERDRNDCLVTANDDAMVIVEQTLAASGDPYAGQALPAWKAHRTTASAACNVLVEAHADAGGELVASVSATCVSDVESQLATLLDAHVDFGVAPFSIPTARDRYPTCYLAFDDEVANAPGVDAIAEAAAASDSLAACIRDAQDAVLPELAARVAATFVGRDPVVIEQDIRDALFAHAEARERVCEIAAHAGPGRAQGGFLATIADCNVDVAIQAGEVIDLVAPGLLEGEPVDPTGDTGGTDSGGTDDGGSDSTG
jgi:hypothetical protein